MDRSSNGGGGRAFEVGGVQTALVGMGAVPDVAENEPKIGVVVCCTLPSAGTAGLLLPLTCPLGVFDRPLAIPLSLALRKTVLVGSGRL